MNTKKRLTCWLISLVACLLTAGLNAQPETVDGLAVRAMLLAPSGNRAELHLIAGAKSQGPFTIVSGGLSETLHPAARAFVFAVPDSSLESGFKTVATVDLPKIGRTFIVLLEPQKAGYKTRVIDGGDPSFKLDSIAFFNASDVQVGAVLGTKKALLKPQEVTIVQPDAMADLPYFQVALYELKGTEQTLFGSTRWPHRSRSRAYVFLFRDTQSGRLKWEAADEVIVNN